MEKKHYHAYFSAVGARFEEAASGLIDFLKSLQRKGQTPVKVHIALAEVSDQSLRALQADFIAGISKHFQDHCPALSVVQQPPADQSPLLAEVWSVQDPTTCRFFHFDKLPHVLIDHEGVCELWSSGLVADSPEEAFEKLAQLLEHQGFSFDDVFRQWNYVGNILEEKTVNGKRVQNYQHFNDVRAVYYQKKKDKSQYPAATGIGMNGEGVCIDFVAVKTSHPNVRNLPMKSPVQTDAYRYRDEVLVGESTVLPTKNAPLFERGRCLLSAQYGIAMISGTASIRGEETIDCNDIEKQTQNTLGFINDLLNDKPQAVCKRARLYIKRGLPPHQAVRLFKAAYPEDCVCTAVFADVCRDNLLIEIEADYAL